jgi:hypothetical protein
MNPQKAFGHKSFSGQGSFLKLVILLNTSGSGTHEPESRSNLVFNVPEQADNLVLWGLGAFNIDSMLRDVMESHLNPPDLIDMVGSKKSFDTRFPMMR